MPALFSPPDPEPWWWLARVLTAQAEAMRIESRRIASAAARTRWNSPAARGFATRAAGAAEQALRHAGAMDTAADLARDWASRLELVAAAMVAGP